jgi:hypothetical protein
MKLERVKRIRLGDRPLSSRPTAERQSSQSIVAPNSFKSELAEFTGDFWLNWREYSKERTHKNFQPTQARSENPCKAC